MFYHCTMPKMQDWHGSYPNIGFVGRFGITLENLSS